MTVSGQVGAPPVVDFETPLAPAPARVSTVLEGDGARLLEGSPALLAVTSLDGTTGDVVDPAGAGRARVRPVTSDALGAELHAALLDVREGTRLVLTQPVAGTAEETPRPTEKADRTLVSVVDVLPSYATGRPQDLPADLGVEVSGEPDETPVVTVTDPAPGTDGSALGREGVGAPVRPGDAVVLRYHAVDRADGAVHDSTWEEGRGPRTLLVDEAFPALREALLDTPVGSRVVLVAPAAEAFGDASLAVVVDVLATSPAQE